MNNQPHIPDAETRKRAVKNLRQASRQLDILNLELEEINANLEAGLRQQRRKRLGLPINETSL